jgi:ubiquitin-conjugating enzyme E2 D/E
MLATIEGPVRNATISLQSETMNTNIFQPETPYSGGTFFVRVHIPKEYPFLPPKFVFLTPLLHPNIDENGEVLIDALCSNKWCPAWTVHTCELYQKHKCFLIASSLTEVVLLGIVSILGTPDWENACVADVLRMYNFDPERFIDRSKLLTKKYALSDEPDEDQSIKVVYEELSQEVQDRLEKGD